MDMKRATVTQGIDNAHRTTLAWHDGLAGDVSAANSGT
jgi:hypothetical protein